MGFIEVYPFSSLMYILFLPTAILLISRYAQKRNSKTALVVMVAILIIVSGIRSSKLGIDTINYETGTFDRIRYGMFERAYGEIGFKAVIWIALQIIDSYTFVWIVLSALCIIPVVAVLWKHREGRSFPFMMFIYYSMFYLAIFNQIRQMIAVGLTFWAFSYVQDKRYLKYCLIIVLTALIHISALASVVILPVSVLLDQKKEKLSIMKILMLVTFVILTLGVAAYVVSNSGIISRLKLYAEMSIEDQGVMAYFYLIAIVGIFGIKKLIILSRHLKSDPIELCAVVYVLLGVVATIWSYKYQYFSRITTQFAIFAILFYTQKDRIKLISQCKYFVAGVFSMYSLITIVATGGYGIMPYAVMLH